MHTSGTPDLGLDYWPSRKEAAAASMHDSAVSFAFIGVNYTGLKQDNEQKLFTIALVFWVTTERAFALLHSMFTGRATHKTFLANARFDFLCFHSINITRK